MKSYFRFLRHNKAYAFIDVLGLAVSMMFVVLIGAYIWNETHLDSQHSKLDRMYMLCTEIDGDVMSGSNWRLVRKLMDEFPEVETGTGVVLNHRYLKDMDGHPVMANVVFVDSTFFNIFDFGLVRGDADRVLADPNSLVVTEEFGRRVWPGEDPIGKTLVFNDHAKPFVVTGIMAPVKNTALRSFRDDTPIEALIPFENIKHYNSSLYNEDMGNATGSSVVLLGKEGVDLKANEQKYTEFAKDFFWVLSMPGIEASIRLIPYKDYYFSDVKVVNDTFATGNPKMVKILSVIGFVILVFALMNYVNLTVALAGYRAKEMATRRLLGSSRGDIVLKLIGESTLLCLVSFAIGFFLAWLALPYAETLLMVKIPLGDCVTPVTVLIIVGIILLLGVMAGIIPAMIISSAKPIDVVRGTFRRRTKMVFSKVFIIVQNVVTITMIAAAITMNMQISHIINAPLGYDTEGLIYVGNGGDHTLSKPFMQRVAQIPGVEAVSAMTQVPLHGGNNNTVNYGDRTVSFQTFVGDENYMKILGLELDRDNHAANGGEKVYLNHQALRELGLAESANSFRFFDDNTPIAGVLKDFRINTILSDQKPVIVRIQPLEDFYPWGFGIKVNGDQLETLKRIQEVYKEIFDVDMGTDRPYIKQQIEDIFTQERNLNIIVTIFTIVAIIISLLGLVAMSSYLVQQRRQEIAVKKVFGCQSGEMVRRLIASFLSYVVIAFVISVPIIYFLMNHWLADFNYRIDLYWWIYLIAGLSCLLTSALAVFVQSHRAANENPINALYQNQ